MESGKYKLSSSDASAAEKYVQLTLNSGTFQTGDKISITYYASKTDKVVNPGLFFGTITGDVFTSALTLQAGETSAGSGSPATVNTLTVTAEGNGTNVLRLTRYAGGTALYITALTITRPAATAPTITTDLPTTAEVKVNVAREFSITATGATSYQWYTCDDEDKTNPVAIDGATNATISYTATAEGPTFIYCVATNATGSTPSTVCRVIATYGPTITQQPASAEYVKGYAATAMHVAATASAGELSYQWYRCDDTNKSNASAISGSYAQVASYTPSTAVAGTFYYFCRVTDSKGSTDSNVATITVTAAVAPTITVTGTPTGSVVKGTEVTLTATVTGNPAPTIKWFSNTTASTTGSDVSQVATGESYSPSTATAGTYYYFAQAVNTEGNATSSIITLTVTDSDIDRTGYNTYYVAEGDKTVNGAKVLCDNITMEYQSSGTFDTAGEDLMVNALNSNYVASIKSGSNGWGVEFTPSTDGTLLVGVIVNGDKTFSITNVTSFDYLDKDGNLGTNASDSWKPKDKFYGIVAINVVSGTKYKFSVSGSKMNLYGFEFVPSTSGDAILISKYEWATFVSGKALDFTSSLAKAYVVTGHTGTAIAKSNDVKKIPANTPLLLNAPKGSYIIPVTAEPGTITTNMLKAGTGAAISAESGKTRYVLGVDGDNAQFQKINATPATVAVGKAYLEFDEEIASRTLDFGGDVTAIKNVKVGTEDNVYYDLQGRRVLYPTKGLYIVNGKKIIIK